MDPSSAKLIIFGPQISYPRETELSQLRSALLQDANLQSFVESILSLSAFWETLAESFPVLFQTPGLRILTDLKSWLENDRDSTPFSQGQENAGFETSNILLTPLTVILQVVQYSHYLSTGHVSPSFCTISQQEPEQEFGEKTTAFDSNFATSRPKVEGFCTGLLAAAAVEASQKKEDLGLFASAALRLAVCIGAFVDAEGRYGENHDETSCLVVSWSGKETAKRELYKALNEFPEIYISVIKDSTSVTLTIPKITIQVFTQRISTLGLISRPILLEGRFHSVRHTSTLSQLQKFCLSQNTLQFPENLSQRMLGTEIELIHEKVLKSILVDQCNWLELNTNAAIKLAKNGLGERLALVFGQFDCFPRALAQQYGIKTKLWKELGVSKEGPPYDHKKGGSESRPHKTNSSSPLPEESSERFPKDSIAIVGMACRFPGADSIEEFWDLLASGRSMVSELPQDRFGLPEQLRRSSNASKYWGNFLKDVKSFDHKFFKKSSREAASMDPQQRLALQVAYEALESSGYFASPLESNSVGVYLGVGSVDYQDNVTSHMPTAFSALGTLRAFISGKISHHFGWTGPSLTYDTACSSSAVAIHQACKALQNGECTMAVTGGVNVITSPVLFQNLGAASFLSPSGASKAFDAKADGYCRGEGCGLVVLKRLSSVGPGDRILAVITGSAVNQNDNSSPITVPHSESQSSLYRQVAKMSEINPINVTYVEAHGTGTPVGDPIEAASVRQVFGGPHRQEKLWLGSVKGNIGHLEAASGAAALIKSILMIQKATIPKQASFTSLNPRIPALAPDNIEIATETQPWNTPFRSVLINNYGAAGSNAALIVCESPISRLEDTSPLSKSFAPKQELFVAAAHTLESLKKFCASIQNAISKLQKSQDTAWFSGLAYNLSHKQNPQHKYKFIATATSSLELWSELEEARIGSHRSLIETQLSPRPIVLCFGGQSNNFVGLEKTFYDDTLLLRKYLDYCDLVCRSTAGISIYPSIFSKEPVTDIKIFHCAIFSLQYACARAWIESGLKVDTVIGHSIGQITALCVSGVLSLTDGLKFLAARGSLIEQHWGSEKGAMIALDASLEAITELMDWFEEKGFELEIACHNGHSSYVLVGSKKVIECVKMLASDSESPGGVIVAKTLKVTHGFHSKFVDSILPSLTEVAKDFTLHEPSIAIETCSEEESWTEINPERIVSHSREPVFFDAAIKRIATRLGSAIWVEAGSMSSITNMVRRVIIGKDRDDLFLPAKFNGSNAMDDLMKTTEALQRAGINAMPWSYHSSQQHQYANINLPPYQFEKAKHWLGYKDLVEASAVVTAAPEPPAFDGLVHLTRYQDGAQLISEFEINQLSQTFIASAEGHAVLGNSLCPISLYIEIVAQATRALEPMASSIDSLPTIENLEVHAPLGIDDPRSYQLILTSSGEGSRKWTFAILSRLRNSTGNSKSHATGIIILSEHVERSTEKSRYERLIGLTRCNKILDDETAESMQGALIYRTFDRVVHYKDYYRGVRRVSAKSGEVTGIVSMPSSSSTTIIDHICNPLAIDCFLQVAGLHVNSLRECGTNELFVCTSISRTLTYEAFLESQSWVVYSNVETIHDKLLSNDIFVFDKDGGSLVMAILGVMFSKVITSSFERALAAVNTQKVATEITEDKPIARRSQKPIPTGLDFKKHLKPIHTHPSSSPDTLHRVKSLLSTIADSPSKDIKNNTNLISLGIDSLMATEVLSDIKSAFQVDIPTETFQSFETVLSLFEYIQMHSRATDSPNTIPISSVFSEFHKQPRDFDSISTPDSSVSLISDADQKSESSKADLLRVLAGHLEVPEFVPADFDLRQAGLDSLGSIELQSDIEKEFGVMVDLDRDITFGALLKLVFNPLSKDNSEISRSILPNTFDLPIQPKDPSPSSMSATVGSGDLPIIQAFGIIRNEYENYAEKSNQSGFYTRVHPQQSQLVLAYITEAFTQLGFPLQPMNAGENIPAIPHLPAHEQVTNQILHILEVGGILKSSPTGYIRANTEVDSRSSKTILANLLVEHPQHASEHQLLSITGSQLALCLTGKTDPLQLIFGSKSAKALLEDVYTNAPMFATGTNLLTSFLQTLTPSKTHRDGGPLRILEIGGGTGGTTKSVIETLTQHNILFKYHFTDISPSLVRLAKTKFKKHESSMDFSVLDIERDPPSELLENFDVVISTNCIHATKNLVTSTTNIRKMLRKDGVLCLIELTRNLYWFDLVFGLLGGWWRFEDGRKHALADEKLWERTLLTAGFEFVDWTRGASRESEQLRLIIAGKTKEERKTSDTKAKTFMETVTYKKEGDVSLLADIYYPSAPDPPNFKRPVALMIHGGGHVMLSRTSIRPAQTRLLLANNFLPISIDYRLCPEISLQSGPMVDVLSALQWIHSTLSGISLKNKTIQADPSRTIAIGWSSGGHLAMSLGWTAPQISLAPPKSILAFYCATDYEDPFWKKPNIPLGTEHVSNAEYDVWEGVIDHPVTGYNVPASVKSKYGWLSLEDPRSRIALHMNWKAQTLPILMGRLNKSDEQEDIKRSGGTSRSPIYEQPSQHEIAAISPLFQIKNGKYHTPTYIIHGQNDDLIPWKQTQRTFETLQQRNIPAGMELVDDAPHLLDLRGEADEEIWEVVKRGYEWAFSYV